MSERYVSRAGLKLAGAARTLNLDFTDKVVLDVGSSTGGFTDFALRHSAKKVIAVDIGTDQLHPKLRENKHVELHEKTDIRKFLSTVKPDIILVDVSFISLREVLPPIAGLSKSDTQFLVLLKPQFEAKAEQMNRGVIKNDRVRRQILADFENWAKKRFLVSGKVDSELTGAKGNRERFYLLKTLK